MNAIVPTIDVEGDIIVFTWTYDDSVNDVPTSNFFTTISLDGQTVHSFTLSSSNRSLSVPLSMLMAGQTYTIDVVVRNLQGNSVAISQIFNVPRSNSVGKKHCCYAMHNTILPKISPGIFSNFATCPHWHKPQNFPLMLKIA